MKANASSSKVRAALALVALGARFRQPHQGRVDDQHRPQCEGVARARRSAVAEAERRRHRQALDCDARGRSRRQRQDRCRVAARGALAAVGSWRSPGAGQTRAFRSRLRPPPRGPPRPPQQRQVPYAANDVAAAPGRPSAANRPDLPGFVKVVQSAAAAHAEGWPGNRKALVSRVFAAIAAAHPGWGLTLVEFKAMLAECHRIGAWRWSPPTSRTSGCSTSCASPRSPTRTPSGISSASRADVAFRLAVSFFECSRLRYPCVSIACTAFGKTAPCLHRIISPEPSSEEPDQLAAAFEHSITWEDDIWRADPVDVEAVHAKARTRSSTTCSTR